MLSKVAKANREGLPILTGLSKGLSAQTQSNGGHVGEIGDAICESDVSSQPRSLLPTPFSLPFPTVP